MSSGKSGSGWFRKKQNTTAIGPGILRYLTKESDNYTTFIEQFINTVIESAKDKYQKE